MFDFPFPWLAFGRPAAEPEPAEEAAPPASTTEQAIEARVLAEVASYGKQLGILAEAVLEIADDRPGRAVERLRGLVARVEMVKAHYQRALEDQAEEAFTALLEADPPAAERLVTALEQRVATVRRSRADQDGAPA